MTPKVDVDGLAPDVCHGPERATNTVLVAFRSSLKDNGRREGMDRRLYVVPWSLKRPHVIRFILVKETVYFVIYNNHLKTKLKIL